MCNKNGSVDNYWRWVIDRWEFIIFPLHAFKNFSTIKSLQKGSPQWCTLHASCPCFLLANLFPRLECKHSENDLSCSLFTNVNVAPFVERPVLGAGSRCPCKGTQSETRPVAPASHVSDLQSPYDEVSTPDRRPPVLCVFASSFSGVRTVWSGGGSVNTQASSTCARDRRPRPSLQVSPLHSVMWILPILSLYPRLYLLPSIPEKGVF